MTLKSVTGAGSFPYANPCLKSDHTHAMPDRQRTRLPARGCWFKGRSLTALLLSVALLVPGATAQESPEFARNVVVVQFAPEVAIANKTGASGLPEFDRTAARYGTHLIERVYPFLDYVEPTPKTRRNLLALRRTYYVRYSAGAAPAGVADDLATAPGVVYSEPVLVYRTQALHGQRVDPDDPLFGEQAGLRLLRLPEAWDVVRSEEAASRVVVAVVDGGGEWRHEDLRANVWTNSDEIAGNGIDDDNNGFIDDVHGVNFANEDEGDNDPTGLPHNRISANHGTAVAGSASAVADNGVGIAGAAWNAEIMHINAGNPGQDGGILYGLEGILYAAANGADIIIASWGGRSAADTTITYIDQTVDLATDMGALVVAAAGNQDMSDDLFQTYPARHTRVLSVGATEKETRTRAGFSNYGKLVNVYAPGVDILTTRLDNRYIYMRGTSFSAPLAAGVAALVKTRFPDMTPDALREHIRLTSDNMDAENPAFAGQLGRGFVNALAAVQAPSLPAVRLQRWSWEDDDGDHRIASGDAVTVTASVVNYLTDARQLRVGLVPAEPYPFIDMTVAEVEVGYLAGGDSIEIRLEFTVATDAPLNQWVRLFADVRDGAHEDQSDLLSFRVNWSLDVVHRSLSAFYTATGGDNWTRNDNWDVTRAPTENELATWAGVGMNDGWLTALELPQNNLTGQLPPEIGGFQQLRRLYLPVNSLTGPLPPEIGDLSQLEYLDLLSNSLTGSLPPEIGNLSQLRYLRLQGNSLTGSLPPEIGNLSQLEYLNLAGNELTGKLPRSLMQLVYLEQFYYNGQNLCAPRDRVFLAWLYSLPSTQGPTCAPSVDVEHETVPESFAVHGNYPNPFRQSTRLVFDLPWPARVTVEVMDITGRRILAVPPARLAAGWGHTIIVSGATLSPGLYLYRLVAATPEGSSIHMGRFMYMR